MFNTSINFQEKFAEITEYWDPKIVAELNGQHVKIAKIKGAFIWHSHENEDELFYVVKGTLKIAFRDKIQTINEGEIIVVPKGVEHKPIAEEEVHIMMFEPIGTVNTGNIENELTKKDLKVI